jgi:hypothetical protein
MSLSEKQIRAIARDELRRIIDAGLMYTFEADQQISGAKPAGFQNASALDENTRAEKTAMRSMVAVPVSAVENAVALFPPELANKLSFSDEGEFVRVKPIKFLGAENFAAVAEAIRGKGEYVSAGKDSHFKLYKKKPTGDPQHDV